MGAAKAIFFGLGTSLFAELQALSSGLAFCLELGFDMVDIESDSKLLVDMLSSRASWPWRHYLVLQRLAAMLANSDLRLRHVFREANAVADGLSKLASSTQQDYQFTSVSLPQNIKGLVALDKVSFPYLRLKV